MKKQKFPPGWDEKRVKELIANYENQTEDEEFADIEAAREAEDITMMAIPTDLVPEIRALLARRRLPAVAPLGSMVHPKQTLDPPAEPALALSLDPGVTGLRQVGESPRIQSFPLAARP